MVAANEVRRSNLDYFEALSRSPTGKERRGTGKLLKKDVKSSEGCVKDRLYQSTFVC